MNNYFGMDSFNRDYASEAETIYCANNMRSRGIEVLPQTAQVTTMKYLDLEGLQTYHDLSQQQIKKLENRIAALEEKFSVSTSALVKWRGVCRERLKRADLNLVFK